MSDGLPVNPTTTVKPTLKTIFRYGYLAAFNAHDGDTLMSYVSPNIKVSRLISPLSPHTGSLRGSRDTYCTLVFVTQGGPTRRDGLQLRHRHNTLRSQYGILTAGYILSERTYYLCWMYPPRRIPCRECDCHCGCDCHTTGLAEHLVWPNTYITTQYNRTRGVGSMADGIKDFIVLL